MTRNIGGVLDYSRFAALEHRPTDQATAARELARAGLKPRDIATTLGLSEGAVLTLLRTPAASPPNPKELTK
jgi:hypothetical protein